MKVLNLRCAQEHRFEGWFGSEDDFQSQLGRSLIECPLCGDHAITRLPSAPRLNVSGAREERPGRSSSREPASADGKPGSGGGSGSAGASTAAGAAPAGTGSSSPAVSTTGQNADHPVAVIEQMQAQWMRAVKHAIANTEDVGQHFAEEARRIHYGEAEERAIRGSASAQEAHSLREEGIEVVALPMPAALKGTLQ